MNLKAHATPEKLKLKWYETTQWMSSDLCGIVIVIVLVDDAAAVATKATRFSRDETVAFIYTLVGGYARCGVSKS